MAQEPDETLKRTALYDGGRPIPLAPKAFALLSKFAAQPGQVLSKEELIEAGWPGVVVTEDSLTQCVHEVRTALGDAGLETAAGRAERRRPPLQPERTDEPGDAEVVVGVEVREEDVVDVDRDLGIFFHAIEIDVDRLVRAFRHLGDGLAGLARRWTGLRTC